MVLKSSIGESRKRAYERDSSPTPHSTQPFSSSPRRYLLATSNRVSGIISRMIPSEELSASLNYVTSPDGSGTKMPVVICIFHRVGSRVYNSWLRHWPTRSTRCLRPTRRLWATSRVEVRMELDDGPMVIGRSVEWDKKRTERVSRGGHGGQGGSGDGGARFAQRWGGCVDGGIARARCSFRLLISAP